MTALIASYLSHVVTAVNRDKKNLALHGIIVKAAVVKIIHQAHGADNYNVAFKYEGKPYTNSIIPFGYKLNVGDSLQIKIDPKDPTGYCEDVYKSADVN